MKSFRLVAAVFLSLASLASLAGCAAPTPDDGADASELVAAAGPDEQRIANVSKETIAANIERFAARNPRFAVDAEQVQTNPLTGAIMRVQNNSPLGAPTTLNARVAVISATAFLEWNLETLQLDSAEVNHASVRAEPYPFESGNFPWTVTFSSRTSQAGFEDFESVARVVNVSVSLRKDGSVGDVWSNSTRLPALVLRTTPILSSASPELLQHVVGEELVWKDPSFVPGPNVAVGAIAAADIREKTFTIHKGYEPNGVVLTLAYELRVERGGHAWQFFVRSRNGEILEQNQLD